MSYFKHSVLEAAAKLVPGWQDILSCPVIPHFEKMTGGMTNALYKVGPYLPPQDYAAAVQTKASAEASGRVYLGSPACPAYFICRVVNPELHGTIDRAQELRVINGCSALGIGPRLYGTAECAVSGPKRRIGSITPAFPTGSPFASPEHAHPEGAGYITSPFPCAPGASLMVRFEEYVEGKNLTIADLRDCNFAPQLAILLARFNYEVSAYAQKLKALEQQQASASSGSGSALPIGSPTTHGESHHGSLPRQLSNYLSMVEKLAATPAFLNKRAPKSIQALLEAADWRSEVDWMTALLADPTWAGQTVLAHGDAQENNWMLLPMDQDSADDTRSSSSSASSGGGVKARLFLIDYEYSSRSPAGFDIGNMYCEHLCEYGGGPAFPRGYSWSAPWQYPSVEWQRAFLSSYVDERAKLQERLQAADGSAAPTPPSKSGSGLVITVNPIAAPSFPVEMPSDADAADAAAGNAQRPGLRERTSVALSVLQAAFSDPVTQELGRQARFGIMAAHLYWCMWSIVLGAGKHGIGLSSSGSEDSAAAGSGADGAAGSGASGAAVSSLPSDSPTATTQEEITPAAAGGFDYDQYGLDRAKEYLWLKAQFLADTGKA